MPVDFRSIFVALESMQVRYVLVGGLAVVLHGVDRLTADVDLSVDPTPDAARRAIDALTGLGFRPGLPVDAQEFANPAIRSSWRTELNMEVLGLYDPTNQRPAVDLFVENPIAFDELYAQSIVTDYDGLPIRIASLGHLIRLKEIAGRPRDLADIEQLRKLLGQP